MRATQIAGRMASLGSRMRAAGVSREHPRRREMNLLAMACSGLACLVVVTTAGAAVSLTDVWYPDGRIRYFIQEDAIDRGYEDVIRETMDYMSAHTPLDIGEESSSTGANLTFAVYWGVSDFCNGGITNGYWDSNHSDSNKKIRFDPRFTPDRSDVAHEFGHALGRPHEFQRDDRDRHVDLEGCLRLDVYNYNKVDSLAYKLLDLAGPDTYENLSPFDHASVMNLGYPCVSPWPDQAGPSREYDYTDPNSPDDTLTVINPLSIHDINGIYRMYGENLGTNSEGDRFGVAVSSGDYDDDGYEDIVVANVQSGGLYLAFYRGIDTDNSEEVDGLKWMPWFKEEWEPGNSTCVQCISSEDDVALATGDFNGDGIDDLALGVPDYNAGSGIVSILLVNTLPSDSAKDSFEDSFAPWGRRGIQHQFDIRPDNVGIVEPSPLAHTRFGASLAAVRATNYRDDDSDPLYHDLVIGAPGAVRVTAAGPFATPTVDYSRMGAVLIVKGSHDEHSPADFSISNRQILWNPKADGWEFGAAVAGVPGLCELPGASFEDNTDFLAVGDPGYARGDGAVHIYGCATSGTGSGLSAPSRLGGLYGTTNGRYGSALAGFRTVSQQGLVVSPGSYLVIGSPSAMVSGSSAGTVSLQKVTSTGAMTLITKVSPSTLSGYDEFGASLAVQQRAFGDAFPDSGSRDTFIAIGNPGGNAGGIVGGHVVVWRPFNADGTVSTSKVLVSPYSPDGSTGTRFGHSLASLRTLTDKGGFVTGAPDGLALDGVQAGRVSILQNNGGDYQWISVSPRVELDQETEGDSRPTN